MYLDDKTPPNPIPEVTIEAEELPCLLLVRGAPQGRVYPLEPGSITLGREPGNTILLDDPSVSRRHARIEVAGEKPEIQIEDLGSTNGTLLNGRPVARHPLCQGDLLQIGTYIFKVTTCDPTQVHYQQKIEERIQYDELTGLFTVKTVLAYTQQEIARAHRYARDFSLLIFDIDHFKRVNDTFGHVAGSALLRELGGVIAGTFRKEIDRPGRYGGDEFLVLLPETPKRQGFLAAERLRQRIESHTFHADGHAIRITVSLGLASFGEDYEPGGDATALLRKADHALYRAKEGGRNRTAYIVRFDETMAARRR